MATFGQNFTFANGDTVSLDFTATDSDGTAFDLTGATIKWQLTSRPGATAILTKQSGGTGISITDAPGGKFTVAIDPTDTVSVARGRYYHEAQVTDVSTNVSTVASGFAVILQGVIA
jgi:hypothetical protein